MVLFVPLLVLLALFFGVINRDYLDHSFLMSDTFQIGMELYIVGMLVLAFILEAFTKKNNKQV